jgi:hypothetical protein
MKMMIINRQHSHLISDKDLPKVELGSIFSFREKKNANCSFSRNFN